MSSQPLPQSLIMSLRRCQKRNVRPWLESMENLLFLRSRTTSKSTVFHKSLHQLNNKLKNSKNLKRIKNKILLLKTSIPKVSDSNLTHYNHPEITFINKSTAPVTIHIAKVLIDASISLFKNSVVNKNGSVCQMLRRNS